MCIEVGAKGASFTQLKNDKDIQIFIDHPK